MGGRRPWWYRHRILVIVLTLLLLLLLALLLAIIQFGWAAIAAYVVSPGLGQDLDNLQKFFTILAILVGGVWTYFNFFKGRTYTPRLEPKVSGRVATIDGLTYLIATSQLKNVGLSQLDIEQRGTALIVYGYKSVTNPARTTTPDADELAKFAVFADHFWIEPGEAIEEQRFIVVPDPEYIAFRLELRIVAHRLQWKAKTITSERFETSHSQEDGYATDAVTSRWTRRSRRNAPDRGRETALRRT
jgi:hypothetical protein